MTALHLISEKSGQEWRVWPDPEPLAPGSVHETGSYLFELRGDDAADADLLIDDAGLEALRARSPGTARWRWQPGFHAGAVELELRMPGRPRRHLEIVTDPDRRKLSRDAFDTMVREILDDTFALFSLGSFRKGIAHGAGGRPPPVARLEFLRSRIEELETVIARIVRSPRHYLAARDTRLPYHRAARATGAEILRSLRSGRVLRETEGSNRLPAALRGYLPERITVRERRSSLDLREHREMAACLRSWANWLQTTAGVLERTSGNADEEVRTAGQGWVVRCRRMSVRLLAMAGQAPFAEAGQAPASLALSALFRNDPAYRRFYRLWQDMNRGIAAVFGSFLDMPLARTFELFELWCFLRLVRAAAEEYGDDALQVRDLFIAGANGGVTLASGAVTVPVGSSWQLCFQKQYREFWEEPDRRGSYSRIMTPDIVLSRAPDAAGETANLIVLDAKYRISEGLNDALSSIHTYRDALVSEAGAGVQSIVSAAYLLAPYVPELAPGYRETSLPGRLFHPAYRKGFRFGAVTLQPGMRLPEIRLALRLLVQDARAER